MDDPEFWTKILPELQQKDAVLAELMLKRKSKQIKRFGMAEEVRNLSFDSFRATWIAPIHDDSTAPRYLTSIDAHSLDGYHFDALHALPLVSPLRRR